MKTEFLHRNGTGELLIFFNGWGRDSSDVCHLKSPGDVLEVHDYTQLDPAELFQQIAPYSKLSLAAWSLGVWAAATVFSGTDFHFEYALALNGTLDPVHPEYGIAPEIFDGTIANWPIPAARERFLRRMAGSGAAVSALPQPKRTAEDQQAELAAIRKSAADRPVPRNPYSHAVLGLRDKIIPFAAQKKFWETKPETGRTLVDLPHYPLAGLSSWEEILHLGNA